LNPEDGYKKRKHQNEKEGTWTKGLKSVKNRADLDVPGSELDDQQEKCGKWRRRKQLLQYRRRQP
jgi:hypothetical protein